MLYYTVLHIAPIPNRKKVTDFRNTQIINIYTHVGPLNAYVLKSCDRGLQNC